MIAEVSRRGPEELPTYDVLVVGSGPAGLVVAAELAASGLAVGVLESGGERVTRRGDRLRRVVSEGIRVKDWSRERVLGGASSTWAGLSSPLDEVDLVPRRLARAGGEGRSPGWPIGREELLGLYEEAAARYRFPPLAFFGPEGFGALRGRSSVRPGWRRVEEKVFLAAAEPQRFGRELRHVFEREGGPDLWLDATVTRLEAEPGGRRVAAAVVRPSAGPERRVRARAFVLATGGIENARLLLVSGLGNEHDQVGRFLMNHPKSYHGLLRLARPVESLPYYFGCLYRGFAGYAGLRLAPRELEERGLLDSYVRFEPLFPWSDSRGVEALVLLAKRSVVAVRALRKGKRGEVVELRDYSETGDDTELQSARKGTADWLRVLGLVLADLPRVVQYLWFRLVPGQRPKVRFVRLRNFMEMEPDPENRVVLADEMDELGVPLALVRHRASELDRRSLIALHEALAEELRAAGVGELESDLARADPWPVDEDASHHMGTTRMGVDPRASVVDPTLRVHGLENLWCAGASVFPTSGCANPTFTIVALSIRLARHLREALAAGEGAA